MITQSGNFFNVIFTIYCFRQIILSDANGDGIGVKGTKEDNRSWNPNMCANQKFSVDLIFTYEVVM